MIESKKAAANSTFAIGGVSCSSESFEVAESSALRINLCAINPAYRKSANRYAQLLEKVLASGLGEIEKFLNLTSI